MNALAFDTLAYARRLEGAGFSRQQAETLAEEQARIIDERLATKADIASVNTNIEALRLATKADIASVNANIEALRLATKADLRETELRLEARIEAVKADLGKTLAETKAETLKWMVGTIGIQTVVIVGAVATLVRLFTH